MYIKCKNNGFHQSRRNSLEDLAIPLPSLVYHNTDSHVCSIQTLVLECRTEYQKFLITYKQDKIRATLYLIQSHLKHCLWLFEKENVDVTHPTSFEDCIYRG